MSAFMAMHSTANFSAKAKKKCESLSTNCFPMATSGTPNRFRLQCSTSADALSTAWFMLSPSKLPKEKSIEHRIQVEKVNRQNLNADEAGVKPT